MPRFRRPRSLVHTGRQVLAGLLALGALVLAARPDAAPPARPRTVAVAVAVHDLAAGAVLTSADLAIARYPPALAPDGATATAPPLVGGVLAAAVRAGEPVTDVRLVGAGLTALLDPGHVAAPVRLADAGVAGLVRTGDRVDVLATAPGAGEAEVVASRVLVLAASSTPEDPGGVLVLAVDPATAARLAAASTTSTLTVSLAPS